LKKIKHFFENYKKTDVDKWSEVKDFLNKEQSEELVTKYSNK
jgi:inorganic pyrophosphatase